MSRALHALRGITAGSGSATTELRVMLLRLLDYVQAQFGDALLKVYVDDMFQFVAGSTRYVVDRLSAATSTLITGLIGLKLTVSTTKSIGVASSADVANKLTRRLSKYKVKFLAFAKSLGGDITATRNRNTRTQYSRLRALRNKRERIRMLRQGGISTARLAREGFNSATAWGLPVVRL